MDDPKVVDFYAVTWTSPPHTSFPFSFPYPWGNFRIPAGFLCKNFPHSSTSLYFMDLSVLGEFRRIASILIALKVTLKYMLNHIYFKFFCISFFGNLYFYSLSKMEPDMGLTPFPSSSLNETRFDPITFRS